MTNSMIVEGRATREEITAAVKKAGYGVVEKPEYKKKTTGEDTTDKEVKKLRKRLVVSLVFLLVLMYFSMGHMMWNWPVPGFMEGNHVMMGLLQMLLTIVIMVINQKFFINGYQSLFRGAPNMDTLVALGASAAFGYSLYSLFAMTTAVMNQDHQAVMRYMNEFYFESAAMILTLITLGKMLEARSKGKTTDALKSLMKLAPQTAVLIRDGEEVTVPVETVQIGDVFAVRPGENIPVDGVVLEGSSAVNEAALTGESIPVDKEEGDQVSAATTNQSGYLKCRAKRVGEDTTLLSGHSNGVGCGGYQGTHCQSGRPGFRYFCTYSDRNRRYDFFCLGAYRPLIWFFPGKSYLSAGDQLPMCAGPGNAGGYHGRKRCWCKAWCFI